MDSGLRRRLFTGLVALIAVVLGGTAGYVVIGDGLWSWQDCLYMTIITLTTVGYGEVLPGMDVVPYARTFTIVLLLFGTGVLVYFGSTVTAFIIEGDLKRVLLTNRLRKRIKKMQDHIIVCGAGSTGSHIIKELIATLTPVVAIDSDEQVLRELAEDFPKANFSYIVGDATDDEVLTQAALGSAAGLVAALASDKDNLYLVVSVRQANPKARIIARCSELHHMEKLKKAGADSVVSPNFIGGMRMVSEMMRPAVVRFLDEMLRDKRTMRIAEVTLPAGSRLTGKSLADAAIRDKVGVTVLALSASPTTPWVYNPDAGHVLTDGTVLVILGSAEQVKELQGMAAA